MGFPENFPLAKTPGLAYRQLGNAVVPPLVAAIAAAIVHAIECTQERAIEQCEADAVGESCRLRSGSVDSAETHAILSASGEEIDATMVNCEAIAVALELALAACAASQMPTACWLPPGAQHALQIPDTMGRASAGAQNQGVCVTKATGAAYHEPLKPGTTGPFAIATVLQAARSRIQQHARLGFTPDTARHVQTLPTPSSSVKSHVATSYVRTFTMVQLLRTNAIRQ